MMKRSKAHQDAVEAKDHAQRQSLAYHHALVASLNKTLQRVGTIRDGHDLYTWQIAFSPKLRDAVIVETFKSCASDDSSTRTFWLDDMRQSIQYASLQFQELYGKAIQIQNQEWNRTVAA
jgi:hypothetical protein